jgi:hypothetical protein
MLGPKVNAIILSCDAHLAIMDQVVAENPEVEECRGREPIISGSALKATTPLGRCRDE